MSTANKESLVRSLLMAILPAFLSTLLFGAVLESFKDEITSRRDIVASYYRPLRENQAECQRIHNQLFIQHGKVAGSYKLMIDEFNHLSTETPRFTPEYQSLLESILTTHTKAKADVDELEAKLESCRSKLFLQYEELALTTGTFDKFKNLAADIATKVNATYKERQLMAQKIGKFDPNELMNTARELLQGTYDPPERRQLVRNKINSLAAPIIEYNMSLSENEKKIYEIDVDLFDKIHEIVASEISDRFSRGFLAKLFF